MKILGLILIFPFVWTLFNILGALVFKPDITDKEFMKSLQYITFLLTLAIYGVIFLFWR